MRVLVAVERVCWQMSEVYIDFALGYVHDLGTLDWPISNEIGHICLESIKMEHLYDATHHRYQPYLGRFEQLCCEVYMTFTWGIQAILSRATWRFILYRPMKVLGRIISLVILAGYLCYLLGQVYRIGPIKRSFYSTCKCRVNISYSRTVF